MRAALVLLWIAEPPTSSLLQREISGNAPWMMAGFGGLK
jgi:hypothetical protein